MDSPAFNSFANIAGRGIGVLAALDTIKSGGLGSYLMNRQRLMGDPGFRASLAGSPFSAGIFGVSGQTGPAPAAPGALPAVGGGVVQPSDFVGPPPPGVQVAAPGELAAPTAYNVPGYMPGQARAWMPNLPPYDPEEALKQQAFASQQQAVAGGSDVQRGLAKTAVGIMPTQAESQAVLRQAADIQRQAGAGSTVGVKFPGMTVQIGSPYNLASVGPDEYPSYETATAAASQRPGYSVIPSGRGTYLLAPPPTKEQTLPPPPGGAPGRPAAPGGPVIRGTEKPPPLSQGSYQPNAFVQGMVNRGWTNDEAAAAAGNAHIESGFIPANVAPGGDSGLIQWAGPRLAGLQSYASATGRSWKDPEAQMDWLSVERSGEPTKWGGSDERDSFRKAFDTGGSPQEMAARFGQFVERPRDLSATVGQRMAAAGLYAPTAPPTTQVATTPPPPPAGGRGVAYAAEPPPGAQVFTPPAPAAAAPTFDPNAVVPHTVVSVPEAGGAVGYPPAAPAVPQAPAIPVLRPAAPPAALAPATTEPRPAAVRPGIPGEPGPTGLPLKGRTQEYQGGLTETYTAPETGDVETTLRLRNAGITDPRLATADQIANYRQKERANTAQKQVDQADISRLERGMTETEARDERRLVLMKGAADRFVRDYSDPATRAQFLGVGTWPWQNIVEKLGWKGAKEIDDFRGGFAPFSVESLTDEKGKPINPDFAALVAVAPSAKDSAAAFESHLQQFRDALADEIAMRSFVRTEPSGSVTPKVYQQKLDELQQARTDRRLAALSPPPPAAPEAAPPPPPPPPATTGWAPNWVR